MVAIASTHSKSKEYSTADSRLDGRSEDFGAPAFGGQGRESEPIVDLVHLSRQAMGDEALELELLDLFERQSARIIAQLSETGAGDARVRGDLAHTLRGSALAVGAGRVARLAQIYEAQCAGPGRGTPTSAAFDALAGAVAEARATIAQLRE